MNKTINYNNLIYFRYKKIKNKFLLSNDIGNFIFLTENEFQQLKKDPPSVSLTLYNKLKNNYFIIDNNEYNELINNYRSKNNFISEGPSLHIVVVTLRCDHKCLYCHASRKSLKSKNYDMKKKTTKKVVDFIFQTTSKNISIEFQGGEPLLNFNRIKDIVEYTKQKKFDKYVIYSIVTNLTYMDDDKLDYLLKNRISICTSLDGPEDLHNKQRLTSESNSYKNTVYWIKRINEENKKSDDNNIKFNKPNALLTTTRKCFNEYKSIIDLYIELGFSSIFLRPLNPFGYGKKLSKEILYSPEEFLNFYKDSLDYILKLNKSGIYFYEKTAKVFLTKIISKVDANFLDLRSPCGAGIGQLAYNYDGNIYTCDEGRMVSEMGDEVFLLGNVCDTSYSEVINSDVVKSMCIASCLEGLPGCNDCFYNPYCGVCPVYNYTEQGNIFGQMPTNDRCKINMGILDYLFSKIEDDDNFQIFKNWIKTP